jgi:hypothetical protein
VDEAEVVLARWETCLRWPPAEPVVAAGAVAEAPLPVASEVGTEVKSEVGFGEAAVSEGIAVVEIAAGGIEPEPPRIVEESSGPNGHQRTAAIAVITAAAPPATPTIRPGPGAGATGGTVATGDTIGTPACVRADAARSLSSSGATAIGTVENSRSGLVCREISRKHSLQLR